ncbi:hypothetical protein GF325_06600 [Candidatus Bathyarchaeota archaeon]|nr:hypothetical protein [Candidatus Bathyarchaeota archaeon]
MSASGHSFNDLEQVELVDHFQDAVHLETVIVILVGIIQVLLGVKAGDDGFTSSNAMFPQAPVVQLATCEEPDHQSNSSCIDKHDLNKSHASFHVFREPNFGWRPLDASGSKREALIEGIIPITMWLHIQHSSFCR